MKLGGKSRDVDSFVDQLKEEGEIIMPGVLAAPGAKLTSNTPQINNTELYVMTPKKILSCSESNGHQMHFHQQGSSEARRETQHSRRPGWRLATLRVTRLGNVTYLR